MDVCLKTFVNRKHLICIVIEPHSAMSCVAKTTFRGHRRLYAWHHMMFLLLPMSQQTPLASTLFIIVFLKLVKSKEGASLNCVEIKPWSQLFYWTLHRGCTPIQLILDYAIINWLCLFWYILHKSRSRAKTNPLASLDHSSLEPGCYLSALLGVLAKALWF